MTRFGKGHAAEQHRDADQQDEQSEQSGEAERLDQRAEQGRAGDAADAEIRAAVKASGLTVVADALALDGVIETYTVDEDRKPPTAVVVARTADAKRFAAWTDAPELVEALRQSEPIGGQIRTQAGDDNTRRITTFTPA